MHAAMPVLFITVIEGIRHLIRQLTGLATGIRIERIPLSRWLLAPRTTFLLGRRMILWHVTSYRDGLALEHEHLTAVSRLQESIFTAGGGSGDGGHHSASAWRSASRQRQPQSPPATPRPRP